MVHLISVKEGLGHIKAADAVEEELEMLAIETTRLVCALQKMGYPYKALELYQRWLLQRFPKRSVAGTRIQKRRAFIQNNWDLERLSGFDRIWMKWVTEQSGYPLATHLRELSPDVIAVSHPLPNRVIANLKARGLVDQNVPLCVINTELVMRGYNSPFVTWYYAANEISARKMVRERGIPESKIIVTGVPIKFEPYDTNELRVIRETLGFHDGPVAYVAGGGLGRGNVDGWVAELLRVPELQLIVVCGENERLARSLQELYASNKRVAVFGFLHNPRPSFAISDLYVGLPGGLTLSETLAYGVVSVFPYKTPNLNAKFVCDHGGGVMASKRDPDSGELAALVKLTLSELGKRRNTALQIAKPAASRDIAAHLASLDQNRHIRLSPPVATTKTILAFGI